MSFHFSPMKAIQCVCWLLDKFPNKRHNYTCVLKLLYLADRESMILARTPITGDIPCALDKGPLLSHIYDLVKGDVDEETQALWSRYVETDGYDIRVVLDPGIGDLSEDEVEILDRIFQEHGQKSLGQLINETHLLPEWVESYREGTSTKIHLQTLLRAIGHAQDYEEVSQQKIEDAHFAKMFGD